MNRIIALSTLFIVAFATAALAESGAGAAAGEHHPSPLDFSFIASVINFVLFVYLLIRFTKKPIADLIATRSEELKEVVAQVTAQREALAGQKAELEAAISELEAGANDRVMVAKQHAEEEARHLVEEARVQADSLISDAKARAEGILKSAEGDAIDHFVSSLLSELREQITATDSATVDAAFLGRVQAAVKDSDLNNSAGA